MSKLENAVIDGIQSKEVIPAAGEIWYRTTDDINWTSTKDFETAYVSVRIKGGEIRLGSGIHVHNRTNGKACNAAGNILIKGYGTKQEDTVIQLKEQSHYEYSILFRIGLDTANKPVAGGSLHLENLTLDGNKSMIQGVCVLPGNDLTLKNTTIQNFMHSGGIFFGGNSFLALEKVIVENNYNKNMSLIDPNNIMLDTGKTMTCSLHPESNIGIWSTDVPTPTHSIPVITHVSENELNLFHSDNPDTAELRFREQDRTIVLACD